MYGDGLMHAQMPVDRERVDRSGSVERCASTTWKMSPAWMYSLARFTISRKSAREAAFDLHRARRTAGRRGLGRERRPQARRPSLEPRIRRLRRRPARLRRRDLGVDRDQRRGRTLS